MNIEVVSQTQRIEVTPGTPRIEYNPQTESVTVVAAGSSVSVINAGPPGPPGTPGSVDPSDLLLISQEIDSKVATHNQHVSPIHENATSGRDFVALFQNGLI
jgi:hypothetical protein